MIFEDPTCIGHHPELALKPLCTQLTNNLEAVEIDSDGTKGTINIGYAPCNEYGSTEKDELSKEFMVEDAEELIGKKNLFFKVFIKSAKGLPRISNLNPFVIYHLPFENEAYVTP